MSKAIFERLSALSNTAPTPDYYAEYQKQVDAEKNDRGAVLLIGSNLETVLETALAKFFVYERFSLLLGNDKPLGSFFNKIRLGYAIDLYGKSTYENLEVVRNVRNAFAHAKIPISFGTVEILDAVNLLDVRPLLPPEAQTQAYLDGSFSPVTTQAEAFGRFKNGCSWIGHALARTYIIGPEEIHPDALKVPLQAGHGRILVRPKPLP